MAYRYQPPFDSGLGSSGSYLPRTQYAYDHRPFDEPPPLKAYDRVLTTGNNSFTDYTRDEPVFATNYDFAIRNRDIPAYGGPSRAGLSNIPQQSNRLYSGYSDPSLRTPPRSSLYGRNSEPGRGRYEDKGRFSEKRDDRKRSQNRPTPMASKPKAKPSPDKSAATTLAQQLKSLGSSEPIIGLKYITEFIYESDEKSRQYECSMCEIKGGASAIASHIAGYQHRRNYIKDLGVAGIENIPLQPNVSSKKEASKKAEAIETIHGRGEWVVEKVTQKGPELTPEVKHKNKQFCLTMMEHMSEGFEIENDTEAQLVSKILKKMTNALVNYKFGGDEEEEDDDDEIKVLDQKMDEVKDDNETTMEVTEGSSEEAKEGETGGEAVTSDVANQPAQEA